MGRASLLSSNFTGGELSPAIALGRMDIAKYNNGAKRIENCTLTVQGGAKRRPGTRFIAETKTSAKKSRLIEFVTNRQVSYVLELGDAYMRFYVGRFQVQDSGSPYELVSPYLEAQVPSVNYVQKADTAFFVHESVYPYRLQRYAGNTNWGFGAAPFITPAIEEQGQFPDQAVNLSNVGPGVANLDGPAGTFLLSDVGRTVSRNGGFAIITSYTSSAAVLVNIITKFKSTALPGGGWNLEGTPQDAIAPSSEGIVGTLISLNANYNVVGTQLTISAWVTGVGSSAVATSVAHGLNTGDTVVVGGTGFIDGTYVITRLSTTQFNFPSVFPPGGLGASGFCYKLQTSSNSEVWRATDVGAYVSINGGMAQITAFIDKTTVNAKVLRAFASKEPAGAGEWQLMTPAWNATKGYPRAVTINKQRLLYAGSPGYPQNMWASEIQGYLNFQFGTADDEAFRFELDGPRNSPILHLAPAKQLLVLTEADEMSLKGGNEKPITATNIQKTDESTAGSTYVRPVKVGNEILFVQAAGKKIMAAAYRFDIDGFGSPERTVFASHITGAGVTQMAHQKEPDSLLYAVRTDGQMAVCAYDIEQEVVGWSRWITQGLFESICTVPTATAEDAYAIVNRTIGGATKRYVEVFDPEMLVDCGITGASGPGQATWTGLGHLEGKLVQCWADGVNMGEFTVTGGAITLPRNANSVQIGLGFTCLVEMLQPEVGGNGTTAQGSQVHVNEVILRLLDTTAAKINGRDVPFRRFGAELLDLPPAPFTGDVRGTTLSDTIFTTSQIITQPYPLPFHLLDVIRRVTINDG